MCTENKDHHLNGINLQNNVLHEIFLRLIVQCVLFYKLNYFVEMDVDIIKEEIE